MQGAEAKCQDLEEKMSAVHKQVTQELECHCAMEFEHMKWEVSEAHLVAQLEALTEVGQAEPREKPTSTSASGAGLAHQHLN